MFIALSNTDPLPLYEQIKKQIIDQITNSCLPPGSPLPSIRSLAKDLEISVITVKRAYEELEAAGYIVTQHGKGSFVAESSKEFIRETKLKSIEDSFEKGITDARMLGLDDEEIQTIFNTIMNS